ncbi:alpha/beta fold hydrolase [Alkalicoccobacillus murimartini]|uniref:Pimeloyl-ACP methyl ester carboxylesterase n=1 Tax=Alkalicoccobacillus murimartini TaxID=171685 RepID=A0ABT9YEE2_9BACI|nr:alpha/beta hydrolase [Alkalicoccobacillus murimartini]MDQ0206215.1 pimeloyl-ACP methyl ester carboxylesterase [Alkalicoccobacillus murimartini]
MQRTHLKTTLYMQGTHVYVERWPCEGKECKGTLLFIHGFLSSSFSFRKLIASLPSNYEFVCLDLPGFGLSGKQKTFCYEFKSYAQLVSELITLYHLKNVTIVGHSMGAQVALYTAKQSPELVDSLVLLSASAYLHQVKKIYFYASYLPFVAPILHKWGSSTDCRSYIEQIMYKKEQVTDEMVSQYGRPLKDKAFYESIICLIRQREGDMSSTDIHQIQHRCLIIWGEQDSLIPVSSAYKLQQDLPNASLIVLPHTGHLVPEEQPKKTARLIRRFLS